MLLVVSLKFGMNLRDSRIYARMNCYAYGAFYVVYMYAHITRQTYTHCASHIDYMHNMYYAQDIL